MSVLRVALTGGIGTGKSYVLRRFKAKGVPTLDADQVARDVVEPGQPAAQQIRRRFGPGVFTADGRVDRARLGERVFTDATERAALEAIVHPRVREAIDAWFRQLDERASYRFGVVGIPLLFETGRDHEFDCVIVTACGPERQRERVMARDGVTEAAAQRRIEAQLPTAFKLARADFVIRTDGAFDDSDRQVDTVHDALHRRATGADRQSARE